MNKKNDYKNFRKEITPSQLKLFLEICSYKKYNLEEISKLISPTNYKKMIVDLKKIYKFALEFGLIEELVDGTIIISDDYIGLFSNNQIHEEEYKEIIRKELFKNKNSYLYIVLSSILSIECDTTVFNKNLELIKEVDRINNKDKNYDSISEEFCLAFRFWSRYLGYSYKLMDEFLIINPYKYIENLNKKMNIKGKIKLTDYIQKLKSEDIVFNNIDRENQLSKNISSALIYLNNLGKINLILENDAIDKWKLNSAYNISGDNIYSHIELEV